MAEKKLEIFKVLEAISKKHRLSRALTEEELKSVQPFVLMRWLSGCSSDRQVYFLNEIVNPYVYALSKHKELLCDLLTVCTSGKNMKYTWVPATSNVKTYPNISEMIAKALECSISKAHDTIALFSDEEILSIANELGYQTEDVAKIKKELRARNTK